MKKGNRVNFEDDSLNQNTPIKNAKAKGKDVTGMYSLKLNDIANTIIFCENKKEAERVRKIYEKNAESFSTVAVKKTGRIKPSRYHKPKDVEEEEPKIKIVPLDELKEDIPDDVDEI